MVGQNKRSPLNSNLIVVELLQLIPPHSVEVEVLYFSNLGISLKGGSFSGGSFFFFPSLLYLSNLGILDYNWKANPLLEGFQMADWNFNMAVVVGAILALVGVYFGVITPREAGLVLLGSMVGGILPDLDMGASTAVRLLEFSAIGLFSFYVFSKIWGNIPFLGFTLIFIGGLLLIFLFFFIIDLLLTPYGIFHSIPMGILMAALGVNFSYYLFHIPRDLSFVIGGAIGVGYLVHLIVDEIIGLRDKDSKGIKALKFWGKSKISTILMYLALIVAIASLPGFFKLF